MRATPSLSRRASTITRPPSSLVMCAVSTRAPSAMPTRSAPSSRALAFICASGSGFRKISTHLLLPLLELLHLLRDHALLALGADPAHVPFRQATELFAALARQLPGALRRVLFRRLLRDLLLHVGEVRV